MKQRFAKQNQFVRLLFLKLQKKQVKLMLLAISKIGMWLNVLLVN